MVFQYCRAIRKDGRFYFDRTGEPGPVAFEISGREYATAVNLFDPRESDLASSATAGEDAAVLRSASFFHRELWIYLSLAALVFSALEWGLYHRRITE